MSLNIFISYFKADENKMKSLKTAINGNTKMNPIVIADRRDSLKPLTRKIIDGINESDIIVPILSKESISSQWVNQEIGYAKALNENKLFKEIKIMPIVDKEILRDLKGFITKDLDIPNNYNSFPDNPKKERSSFRKAIASLIEEIEQKSNLKNNLEETKTLSKKKQNPDNNFTKLKKNGLNEINKKNEISQENKFFDEKYFKEAIRIIEPKIQLVTTLRPHIIEDSGIINYWVNVSSHHNMERSHKREMYITSIFSDATYFGEKTIYRNLWAILREAPTSKKKTGSWKFTCSGIEEKITTIESRKILSPGWHLFSVEWSRQMDHIKFYIDTSLVGEKNCLNWPRETKTSLYIGTWPDKNPESQFFSEICLPIFIGKIDSRVIPEIYAHKP